MPVDNEEGSLHTGRVRLRRESDGDIPLQPSRAQAQHVSTESTRYAATLLASISQVSLSDIRDYLCSKNYRIRLLYMLRNGHGRRAFSVAGPSLPVEFSSTSVTNTERR